MNPVTAQAKLEKKRQIAKNAAKRAQVRQEKLAQKSSAELQEEIAKLDRSIKAHANSTGGRLLQQAADQKKKLEKELQAKFEAERIEQAHLKRHVDEIDCDDSFSSSKRAKHESINSSIQANASSNMAASTMSSSVNFSTNSSVTANNSHDKVAVIGLSSIIGSNYESDEVIKLDSAPDHAAKSQSATIQTCDCRCSADVPIGYLLLSPPSPSHNMISNGDNAISKKLWRIPN
jgi:hypothetical protein